MSGITSLDKRVDFGMFLKGMAGRFQSILAKALTPEEKLKLIITEMEKDVQEKRVLARQIGAQMRALADPDTAELEPLEAAQARRAKLVKLGSTHLDNAERLGQIQQEIKGVDALIASQQGTYDELKGSYELARGNYQTALQVLESTRTNGPAIIKALQARDQALAMRDKARKSETAIDTQFMDDLTAELAEKKAELRADQALDSDLDAEVPGSVDAELAKMDAATVDDGLMAEFRAAAGK